MPGNLNDPNNLWLTIDHRTSRMSTADILALTEASLTQLEQELGQMPSESEMLAKSREFAIDAQGISSR